jgi:DNA-binding MarR family transcriptional regulator
MRVYARVVDEHCYCAALRAATRRVTALYDDALAPAGVNLAQYSLLRTVARRTAVSLSELGGVTGLDRSTIGRNVRLLQRMALVAITPGQDRREATVSVAPAGEDALRRGAAAWEEAQARVRAALGGDGTAALLSILTAL